MRLPQEYATNVLEAAASKLKEFEDAEYVLMSSHENNSTLWRSQASVTSRLDFLRMMMAITATTMKDELEHLKTRTDDAKIIVPFVETYEAMLAMQFRMDIIAGLRVQNVLLLENNNGISNDPSGE